MPAYLVAVYSYPDRATATADTIQSVLADSCIHAIHDTPPVILGGLAKGGEFPGLTEWFANATRDMLCLAADGRIVNGWDHAKDAEFRGAFPLTWYRYEAP